MLPSPTYTFDTISVKGLELLLKLLFFPGKRRF